MRLDMRQINLSWRQVVVGTCSPQAQLSHIKPILPIEMWPSVTNTRQRNTFGLCLSLLLHTAIRYSGGEHYWYLANQNQSVFSSDVTSLLCRAVEVAREVLPLPVHLLPDTAERNNAGRMYVGRDRPIIEYVYGPRQNESIPTVPFFFLSFFWRTSHPKKNKLLSGPFRLQFANSRLDERATESTS